MEDLGDQATILSVLLDSPAFKTKLLNECLYLEMEDLGHLAQILNAQLDWTSQPSNF